MKKLSKIVFFFFAIDFLSASLHFHYFILVRKESQQQVTLRIKNLNNFSWAFAKYRTFL